LTINILFVYFIKSEKKYWLLSIPLWALVFSSFILWRTNSDKHIQAMETEYWNEKKEDNAKWDSLELAKKKAQKINMIFIYFIGLQTLITFICQIVGQRQTEQKIYKWTKPIFGVLFIFIFLLIVMMGIVPAGGIIG
jgi:Na+/proline symporter